jgi:hypothetical protein
MMEALVGSLPKSFSISVSEPYVVNSDAKDDGIVQMDKEVGTCFQIPEACVSEDTSKFSGSEDKVQGLSGNNMVDSDEDEDMIFDEAHGNQLVNIPTGDKQVVGMARCSYADIMKFPKNAPKTGLSVLEESLEENMETSEDESSKARQDPEQRAIGDAMKDAEINITDKQNIPSTRKSDRV